MGVALEPLAACMGVAALPEAWVGVALGPLVACMGVAGRGGA